MAGESEQPQSEQPQSELSKMKDLLLEKDKIIQQKDEEIAELKEKLAKAQEMAGKDPLMETLLNRRAGEENLVRLLGLASRGLTKLVYCRIDIDFFKQINDTYGHPRGDEVLKALVGAIETQRRDQDLFFRYGGEEFDLVLSLDTDISDKKVLKIVERYLEAIRQLKRSPKGDDPLTASIGVSIINPNDKITIEEIQKKADDALYEAKTTGRNKIVIFGKQEPQA